MTEERAIIVESEMWKPIIKKGDEVWYKEGPFKKLTVVDAKTFIGPSSGLPWVHIQIEDENGLVTGPGDMKEDWWAIERFGHHEYRIDDKWNEILDHLK